jgi:hypothetical protein
VTGAQSYAGRYWPTDWRAYYELKGETLVSRQEPADAPPAVADQLIYLAAAGARTDNLVARLAGGLAHAAEVIAELARRVEALEARAATPGDPHGWQPPARPVPTPLSGCTCGGIGDTGAHYPGCSWSAQPNPGGFNPGARL